MATSEKQAAAKIHELAEQLEELRREHRPELAATGQLARVEQ